MRATPRIQTAFRFDAQLLNGIKAAAKRENRSLNSYVEMSLSRSIKDDETPNAETVAAIEDAINGVGLQEADITNLDTFLKSLGLK